MKRILKILLKKDKKKNKKDLGIWVRDQLVKTARLRGRLILTL